LKREKDLSKGRRVSRETESISGADGTHIFSGKVSAIEKQKLVSEPKKKTIKKIQPALLSKVRAVKGQAIC